MKGSRGYVYVYVYIYIYTHTHIESYAPDNDVSVDGPHIRRWSHKIIMLQYNILIPLCYNCIQYSVQ